MPPRAERARIGHGRGERGGDHRADAGHLGQRPADRVGAGQRDQAPVEPGDLALEVAEMGGQDLQHLAGERRDAVVLDLADEGEQLPHAGLALRRDDAELGQMAAQGIDRRRALADQLVAHPMQHQHRLLRRALDRYEPHARPLHGLAACLGVGRIMLVALDVGLDVLRRHQPCVVAEPAAARAPSDAPRRPPRARPSNAAGWRRTPAPWRASAAFSARPGRADRHRAPETRSSRCRDQSW